MIISQILILSLLWLGPPASDGALQVGSKAPSWSLKDTNDASYDSSSLNGKTIVIIGGDKKSQESNEIWASRVKESCGSGLTGLGIADVSAAPKFFRGVVRNQMRTGASRMGVPILLDWDGSVSRSFHFKADVSNVFVISPDSVIRYAASGSATDDGMKQLCTSAAKQPH